ncbi:hypothetical protein IL099_002329 [Enterococcus hirae]|nr:hypothetical protein [Enterococcus hirae]
MIQDVIRKEKIGNLNFQDPFFESLRKDYPNFDDWLMKKSNEDAYVFFESGMLGGFLYLKDEFEESNSITPIFEKRRRLKIGTFKINSHGTVLGQRFLSITLRKMYEEKFDFTYVTIYKKQTGLLKLFEKFGFKLWGTKSNGELVYYKDNFVKYDIYQDFPRINKEINNNKFLLSIYPRFHTDLFPDSKLLTERQHSIEDLSFTNTIEKIYIARMSKMINIKQNDIIVIYRTAEEGKSAEYSSVATSICSVVEVKHLYDFTLEEFLKYCGKGSIFPTNELIRLWNSKKYPYIIKMLYNVPLKKRITRHDLIEKVGIKRESYFGCLKLTDEEFNKILEIGEVDEGFIID